MAYRDDVIKPLPANYRVIGREDDDIEGIDDLLEQFKLLPEDYKLRLLDSGWSEGDAAVEAERLWLEQ